jgi:4-hydroxythreonine-4-phosphate dehydrogenase
MSQQQNNSIKIGISIGDINGIGMEIIMKTFADNRILENITPIVYGSGKIASYYKKALNFNEFNFHVVNHIEDIKPQKANLLNIWSDEVIINMGQATENSAKYAFRSLEAAVKDLAGGKTDALVTAPINKKLLQSDRFKFPGHTEYLANLSNVDEALMMMVSDNLRVGLVTAHIPLSQVSSTLTKEKILNKIKMMHSSLQRDFGIAKPKIAVLGLNPHAGEEGLLGKEEKNIIEPAITQAFNAGIVAIGPYPADGLFGSGNFKNFDGILAMYHDQGLTPFKTLAFDNGVNYTAGLPIVRTSPDHGTGYDIAGKGIANESSFRNAVFLARDIYLQRKWHKQISANPLQKQQIAIEKGE